MIPENTIENKEKFFALYWNQKVLHVDTYNKIKIVDGFWIQESQEYPDESYLELKPLSAISDEDAIEVGRLNGSITSNNRLVGHGLVHWLHKEGTSRDIPFEAVDYLRSKGYALPYLGISVEEQISRGWVKLRTE